MARTSCAALERGDSMRIRIFCRFLTRVGPCIYLRLRTPKQRKVTIMKRNPLALVCCLALSLIVLSGLCLSQSTHGLPDFVSRSGDVLLHDGTVLVSIPVKSPHPMSLMMSN